MALANSQEQRLLVVVPELQFGEFQGPLLPLFASLLSRSESRNRPLKPKQLPLQLRLLNSPSFSLLKLEHSLKSKATTQRSLDIGTGPPGFGMSKCTIF
jgi:hypothetical protein